VRRRLERLLPAAIGLYNRNPWTANLLHPLPRAGLYAEDGLWTPHGHSFTEDERFARAYRRAVRAGGFDYAIRWRVHVVLWASERASSVEGAFVECGTGRGFMASAVCEYLKWTDRPFYLYDTFLPTIPDEKGLQTAAGTTSPHYAEGPERVAENFAEWSGVQLVIGAIPYTLLDTGRVAFLHVDLNNAAAEEAVVRHFWPRLAPGALIIFDDYGFAGYEAQREAADRLGRELGFQVLALPTGQGLVLR
jgi:Methyltransferase domain